MGGNPFIPLRLGAPRKGAFIGTEINMTRRGKITLRVTSRVTVMHRRTVTSRPIYSYDRALVGPGRMVRVVCDGCNTAIESGVSGDGESIWCPNCEQYIAIEG